MQNPRLSRQRTLPDIGASGNQRLADARVAIIGAGGLGSPVIQYLAAAGVGHLDIFDGDVVELSNMNRQVIHDARRLGVSKVLNAVTAVNRIAPEIEVEGHHLILTPANILDNLAHTDVIVDGSDSFNTRFVVSHAAQQLNVPVVFGALMQWAAQLTVFNNTITLADVFPDTPQTRATPGCAETGIMGSVAGIAGSFMATETIKLITGAGQPLTGRMLIIDALSAQTTEIPLSVPTPLPPPADIIPLDIRANVHWVDVRRTDELTQPAPVTATHLPFDELVNALHHNRGPSLNGELGIICRSGVRALRAARELTEAGYCVAGYLDGGVLAHSQE